MTRTLVVGAGLAGLSCAHALASRADDPDRRGREVLLLEAAPRAGGVVGTLDERGFRFETGPHTVPASAATFRALAGELGLADRLQPSDDAARVRLLFHRGRPVPLPASPLAFLRTPLLSARAKLRLLSEPLRRHLPLPPDAPEPSLADFLGERLGPEAARRLGGAFVRGVYAGEIERLGARSAFPRLWQLAEQHGGLARGLLARARARRRERPRADSAPPPPPPGPEVRPGSLLGFSEGMQVLVDALATRLGERLRTGTEVRALARRDGVWEAALADGERVRARRVVLAVPAAAAAALLESAGTNEAANALRAVEYADVTVVHLGLDAAEVPNLPLAFGCLVPPDETAPGTPRFLGSLFPSRIFPGRAPAGAHVVSSFYRSADLAGADPVTVARADLGRLLGRGGGTPAPRVSRVVRWDRAIPEYAPGHDERLAEVEQYLARTCPGLSLAASYVGGVSVESVLARGRDVAQRILSEPDARA